MARHAAGTCRTTAGQGADTAQRPPAVADSMLPTQRRWYAARTPLRARLFRRLRPLFLGIILPLIQHHRKKNAATHVLGLELQTVFDVYHPRFFVSSRWLAEKVRRQRLRGRRFLDMGTGSGLIGLVAAKCGARVTAVDTQPLAVQLAQENARRQGLADGFDCFVGDLFSALPRMAQFDVIAFDPPMSACRNTSEGSLLARFFAHARDHLAANGRLLLVLSSDLPLRHIDALIQQHGYRLVQYSQKHHILGSYHFLELQLDSGR
ncbi:MAG: methyltransferase [candidate division KSB1 bacterium]|nr:methyltransferase [candidate division KSB1 bacterium]MDQ7065176.1 methyltransferase [candidate division KSB1 bacterium]